MSSWADLDAELDLWSAAGLTPKFWWRDDDAQKPTPALDRLLTLSDRHAVPAHIAVIPSGVDPALAHRLRAAKRVHVLQHGLSHINHEPAGQPASEIGPNRDLALQCADLRAGWQMLQQAGLPGLVPMLVPPWNTIAGQTRKALPSLGYLALSSYAGRNDQTPVPGLAQFDAHLDPVRWKRDRAFRGTEKMLGMVLEILREQRKTGKAEPIGYLTHHLQTHDDIWAFTDRMFSQLAGRADWISLSDRLERRS